MSLNRKSTTKFNPMKIIKNALRPIKELFVFYIFTFRFSMKLVGMIFKFHPDVWMKMRLVFEIDRFMDTLNSKSTMQKTTSQSKEIYQGYDDREIRAYFLEYNMMLMNNRPVLMSFRDERQIHLSYIYEEIDTLLKNKEKLSILEVGCGNCINIYEIMAKYGDRVEVHGIDISDNRIENGVKYFGDDLSQATFHVGSISEKTEFQSDCFDLVFSMFCLEQIAYEMKPALQEMYRISSQRIVMIEPVFENATLLQKIYLIHSDHTRILLRSLHELNLPLVKNEILELQCNPSNQSSVLVINKSKVLN